MPRSLALYLNDLMKATDNILTFTSGMDRNGYEANELVQRAVERSFEIIGEALNQMRQHYPDVMRHVEDTRQIIAFRNVLAHNYSTVDNDDVWSAIQSKLPGFRKQVMGIVAREASGEFKP